MISQRFLSPAFCMEILRLFNGLEGKLMVVSGVAKNAYGFVPVNRAFLKMTRFSGYDTPHHSQKIKN